MKTDKELILRQIKLHLGIKTDAEFARFLGIKPQTLSTWYARNTFDFELVYSKCVSIDGNWLLTGTGKMLKSEVNNQVNEPVPEYGSLANKDKLIIELQQEVISLMKEIVDLRSRLPVSEQPIVSTTPVKNAG